MPAPDTKSLIIQTDAATAASVRALAATGIPLQEAGQAGLAASDNVAAPILAKLNALRPLTTAEAERVAELGRRPRRLEPGAVLLEQGERARRPLYVVSGWAGRLRILPDGRRQIVGLVLPGDGVGLCRRPRPLAFMTTAALTRLVVVDAAPLLEEADDFPDLAQLFERAAALDEELLLNQAVRLGRQTAYERMAGLLLELEDRLGAVGLVGPDGMPFPLTQEVLADVLGLSIVHVNRTLQHLRRDRLVALSQGRAQLLDREQLAALSNHRPLQMLHQAVAED